MKEWAAFIHARTQAKPLMAAHNAPEAVSHLVRGEADELVAAIQAGEDAFSVGSELADVLYLTLYLCHELGFDPEQLLKMKDCRNELKYPPELLQTGNYGQVVADLKQRWDDLGGDMAFSHWYTDQVEP